MWHPEPAFRGTYGLLSSCIVTLGLCVWTAVHLDIPEPGHASSQWRRRLKWLAVGMFAPEMVTYTAWVQRGRTVEMGREAKRHGFIFDDGQNKSKTPKPLQAMSRSQGDITPLVALRKNTWTTVHNFYACMGGFVFDTTGGAEFLPDSRTHAVLTHKGVCFIMKYAPDLIPDISREFVVNKSKANSLAKLLVCTQAGWFCLQCLARAAQRLPVSLLELNTLAHALCTLITYIMWWRKPFDINEPTIIKGENARILCAYMWMASLSVSRSTYPELGQPDEPEFELISIKPRSPMSGDGQGSRSPHHSVSDPLWLYPSKELGTTGFTINPDSGRFIKAQKSTNKFVGWMTTRIPRVVSLEGTDAERWTLASRAMHLYGLPRPDSDLNLLVTRAEMPIAPLTILPDTRRAIDFRCLCGFAMVSALYGGLHIIAWNANLPSTADQIWWHWAAIYVVAFGIIPPFISLLNLRDVKSMDGALFYVVGIPGGVLLYAFVFGIPFYWVARAFLVVESFKQVFFLPPEAFILPLWSRYIPHFS